MEPLCPYKMCLCEAPTSPDRACAVSPPSAWWDRHRARHEQMDAHHAKVLGSQSEWRLNDHHDVCSQCQLGCHWRCFSIFHFNCNPKRLRLWGPPGLRPLAPGPSLSLLSTSYLMTRQTPQKPTTKALKCLCLCSWLIFQHNFRFGSGSGCRSIRSIWVGWVGFGLKVLNCVCVCVFFFKANKHLLSRKIVLNIFFDSPRIHQLALWCELTDGM